MVSRTLGMLKKYTNNKVPSTVPCPTNFAKKLMLLKQVYKHIETFNIDKAIHAIQKTNYFLVIFLLNNISLEL